MSLRSDQARRANKRGEPEAGRVEEKPVGAANKRATECVCMFRAGGRASLSRVDHKSASVESLTFVLLARKKEKLKGEPARGRWLCFYRVT